MMDERDEKDEHVALTGLLRMCGLIPGLRFAWPAYHISALAGLSIKESYFLCLK